VQEGSYYELRSFLFCSISHPASRSSVSKSISSLDSWKTIWSIYSPTLSLSPKSKQEKDEDIKRELRKGNIVTVIEEALNY